jgi:hypothetical protein
VHIQAKRKFKVQKNQAGVVFMDKKGELPTW